MTWLSEMEYPHWLMIAGAWLVVAGFIGLGFSRYMNRAPAEDNLHPAAPPPNSTVAGRAEGEEMSARHSSAGLWKPADDDQLREMAASGKGPSAHGAHQGTLDAVWRLAGKNDDAALFDERYLGDLGQSG